tara:strand:- start:1673 stop:3610 length:1938 start_codon:yes stop_codon:yes gene_type:complete
MKKVTLPNGEVINFPDTMSASEIKDVIKNRKVQKQDTDTNQSKFNPTAMDKLRLGLQGATFSGGDEIVAGIKAPFSDKTYSELLKEERKAIEDYRKARPLEALGLEVAGALPTAIGSGVGLLRLIPRLAKASNLTKAVGIGGIEGATYGFGSGEGVADRLKQSAIGGTVGSAGGGFLSTLGNALNSARRRIFNNQATRTDREANKIIKKALDADDIKLDDLQKASDQIQSTLPKTLTDLADANTRGLSYVASQGQSKGKKIAEDFLTQRNVQASDRVVNNVQTFLNPTKARNVDDITNQLQSEANVLYDNAYTTNSVPNLIDKDSVKDFYNLDVFQKAIKETRDLVSLDSLENPQALQNFDNIFKVNKTSKKYEITDDIPIEFADKIKQGIDAFIEKNSSTALKQGSLSKTAKRKVVGLQKKYLETLDNQNLIYKNARQIFSDKTSIQDAFDEGMKYKRLDIDELSDTYKALKTTPEKKAFRLGVSKAVNEEVIKKPDSASDVYKTILGSNKKKKLFEIIAPDKKSYNNFIRNLESENKMFRTQKDVLLNSKTNPRELFASTVDKALNPQGVVKEFAKGVENFIVGRNPQELRTAIIDKTLNPNSRSQVIQQLIDADKKNLMRGLLDTQPLLYPSIISTKQGLLE